MKKQTLLFMAGGLMAIASCNTNTGDTGMTQATIDSTVNARVEEIRTEMMRQNDSLINAMAMMKADSIIASMKSGAKPAAKPAAKAPGKGTGTAVDAPVNTPPVNPKESRFNGQGSNTQSKEARFNEDAAKKQQEEKAKKKEDRFK